MEAAYDLVVSLHQAAEVAGDVALSSAKGGFVVRAHRVILREASDYFTQSSDVVVMDVLFADDEEVINKAAVDLLIRYMYRLGGTRDANFAALKAGGTVQVIQMADKFLLNDTVRAEMVADVNALLDPGAPSWRSGVTLAETLLRCPVLDNLAWSDVKDAANEAVFHAARRVMRRMRNEPTAEESRRILASFDALKDEGGHWDADTSDVASESASD